MTTDYDKYVMEDYKEITTELLHIDNDYEYAMQYLKESFSDYKKQDYEKAVSNILESDFHINELIYKLIILKRVYSRYYETLYEVYDNTLSEEEINKYMSESIKTNF